MMIRRTAVAMTSAAALSLAGVAAATPASAAPNNVGQDGLINLALTGVTIQAPITVAANVCGVAVNVLASQLGSGPVDCTVDGVATAERDSGGGANNVQQRGLVNVAVTDATVQVPVAVAANVCGIGVNVLSTVVLPVGPVDCQALAMAAANG